MLLEIHISDFPSFHSQSVPRNTEFVIFFKKYVLFIVCGSGIRPWEVVVNETQEFLFSQVTVQDVPSMFSAGCWVLGRIQKTVVVSDRRRGGGATHTRSGWQCREPCAREFECPVQTAGREGVTESVSERTRGLAPLTRYRTVGLEDRCDVREASDGGQLLCDASRGVSEVLQVSSRAQRGCRRRGEERRGS